MTDFGKRSGHRYIDRGDPSAADFIITDFTTDGAWHDLDFSSIIPPGAVLVHFYLTLQDNDAFSYIQFRKKGNSNAVNLEVCMELIANLSFYWGLFVSCDSDGVIEYLASNTTFTSVIIIVRGWFI